MEYYKSCAGKREKDTLRNPNSHTQSDCVTVVLLVDGLYCLIWRIVTPSTEHFVKHENTRHKKTNKKKVTLSNTHKKCQDQQREWTNFNGSQFVKAFGYKLRHSNNDCMNVHRLYVCVCVGMYCNNNFLSVETAPRSLITAERQKWLVTGLCILPCRILYFSKL